MIIKIRKMSDNVILPSYAHADDAGVDLRSTEEVLLKSGEYCLIKTGLGIEIPSGIEGQIRPRSGLALKYGVTVLNSPGTIDAGYRGEIGILLINHGKEAFQVERSMRIAQLVFSQVIKVEFEETDNFSSTGREEKGFGSSGTM